MSQEWHALMLMCCNDGNGLTGLELDFANDEDCCPTCLELFVPGTSTSADALVLHKLEVAQLEETQSARQRF